MLRLLSLVGVALLLACDSVVASRLQLTPAAPAVESARSNADALAAVDRLAVQFGLGPETTDPRRCARAWRSAPYRYRNVDLWLYMCARVPTADTLELYLAEALTTCWSPKGDSLRVALADTLAHYGNLRDRAESRGPPNGRCS
jgi:hypothetical protein